MESQIGSLGDAVRGRRRRSSAANVTDVLVKGAAVRCRIDPSTASEHGWASTMVRLRLPLQEPELTGEGAMSVRTSLACLSLVLSVSIGWTISRSDRDAAAPAEESKVVLGLSLGTLQQERWIRDQEQFKKRAAELGAEVLVQSGNSDGQKQIQDIESLITREVDVLVIVAFNPAALQKAVELARKANVPVICYDRMIIDCDVDLYISFDNIRVGKLQATSLVKRLGGRGRIVRVHGPKTDHTAQLFKQGQDQVLEPLIKSGAIEVVHEDYAESYRPEAAKRIVNAAITAQGRDLDAILAVNDGTAGGAVQALLDEGLAGKVYVTGQDADLAACQRILRGSQTMTVYKPLPRLAIAAADAAFAMASGRPLIARYAVSNGYKEVPSILEEVIAVNRENLFETVVQDGFHREEDLR